MAETLRALAKRYPQRARLVTMGKSLEGREILALEITDYSTGPAQAKPVIYAQGAIHGNEISSMMTVLYMAHRLAANAPRLAGHRAAFEENDVLRSTGGQSGCRASLHERAT